MNKKIEELKQQHQKETELYEQLLGILRLIPKETKAQLLLWIDPLLSDRADLLEEELSVDQISFLTFRSMREYYDFQKRFAEFQTKSQGITYP